MNFNIAFLVVAVVYAIADVWLILHYLPIAAREMKQEVRPRAIARLMVYGVALFLVVIWIPKITNSLFFDNGPIPDNAGNILGALSILSMVYVYSLGLIMSTALSTFFPDFTLRLCAKLGVK